MSCFIQSLVGQEVKVSYKAGKSQSLVIPNFALITSNDFTVDSKTGWITYLGSKQPTLYKFDLSLFYPSSDSVNSEISHHLSINKQSTSSLTNTLNANKNTVSGFCVASLKKNDVIKIEGLSQSNYACSYCDIKLSITPF